MTDVGVLGCSRECLGLVSPGLTLLVLPADHWSRHVGRSCDVLPEEGRFCRERKLTETHVGRVSQVGPEGTAVSSPGHCPFPNGDAQAHASWLQSQTLGPACST